MIYLAVYCLLTILAFTWIRFDFATGYVFDVFGKSFHWVWYEYGHRWKTVATHGWRLLLLAVLVAANVVLAYLVFRKNALAVTYSAQIVLHLTMLLGALAPIPWVGKAHQLRRWRSLHQLARKIEDTVRELKIDRDPPASLAPAELAVESPWTAWYPSLERWREWKSEGPFHHQPLIFYVGLGSVIVLVSPNEFLCWNAQTLELIGKTLPFQGPLESRLLVTESQTLGRGTNWSFMSVRTLSTELDEADRR